MSKNSRREFLIATAGVGVWLATGLAQARSANEKLNLGFIGVTGGGGQNMAEMTGENVAALCDVDAQHLGKAAERFPKARKFRDFRKMIDEAKDLDAVGTVGNMGPHLQDLPFWALKLRYPLSVEAEGPPVDPESPPKWIIVRYEYGVREDLPPVKLTWYHGGKHPNFPEAFDPKAWTQGILFVGEKGQLAVDYKKLQLLPQSTFADFTLPKSFKPESSAHHAEWIRACKTGEPTSCPFEYAGPLAEAVQLGLVAYRVGQRIEWDATNLKATNCPEADRFIRPQCRKGWEL